MRPETGSALSALILAVIFLSYSLADSSTPQGTGGCKPSTWELESSRRSVPRASPRPIPAHSVPLKRKLEAGDIHCRFWHHTYAEVGPAACEKLVEPYTDMDTFFELNPILQSDCKNIKPWTKYCIQGYIEPLRANDGFCGPLYSNATCLGTTKECCNSETWTCGDRDRDCTPSLCYKDAGVCYPRVVVSHDARCGRVQGRDVLVICGKWGECCNLQGICGSGPDFCGQGVCQLGECTHHDHPLDRSPDRLSWEYGEADS